METPPNITRGYLWMEILANPILWGMNALLALLLWGDFIASKFPATDDYFRYLAPLTALPWQWRASITIVVNIVLFLELSFRAVGNRERQRNRNQSELQETGKSTPHI